MMGISFMIFSERKHIERRNNEVEDVMGVMRRKMK